MITTLGLLAVALALIILFQISQSSELLNRLRGGKEAQEGEYTSSTWANDANAIMMIVFLVLFLVGTFWSAFYYAPRYLPEPSSVHGDWLRSMFQRTLWATVPVFVLCHILLFAFAFSGRRKKGMTGKFFPHSNKLELIWTTVPAIVMVVLVVDGMITWNTITAPAPEEAMVVEATAQQFLWTLRYSGEDNVLGNKSITLIGEDNAMGQDWNDEANKDDFITQELHLPLGKPVSIKINSIDVLHSFYLPHFRVKMDAVPGIPTQFWFTPTKTTAEMRAELDNPEFNYELACAELCGKAHFNMRRVVIVETQEEFDAWKKEQTPYWQTLQDAKREESLGSKNDEEAEVVSMK